MAEIDENISGNAVHQEGTEHIKDKVFEERQTGSNDAQPQGDLENENTQNSTRDDNENKNLPDTETSGENEHKPPQHEESTSKSKGSSMENRESIPTAGGQKLGEKHWGESSIVPDVPPKRESEANIASKDGQPTGETASNTAANTGGATGGSGHQGSGSEEKQKFTDKIKDKLNIGKKE
ncbi:hypothetical protein DOTSEDRAFT_44367 [Dothistroma septosporum NZE10]|uniref:Uncharacterized protein n=1 Tax=Dothistroma septosporum (strain NZE10 / CBS 128990) TaxID=675120 RepID=N1PKT7_DOTSN|nr:hypothetical protein DOTSEDRAFT_44367 [Dothistroma septosporum NZE10]